MGHEKLYEIIRIRGHLFYFMDWMRNTKDFLAFILLTVKV